MTVAGGEDYSHSLGCHDESGKSIGTGKLSLWRGGGQGLSRISSCRVSCTGDGGRGWMEGDGIEDGGGSLEGREEGRREKEEKK